MSEYQTFGSRLKSLRETNSLKQEEISKILGVARNTYTQYEKDSRFPSIDVLNKILEYFDITYEEIVLGKKAREQEQSEIEKKYIAALESNAALNEQIRQYQEKELKKAQEKAEKL